MAGDVQDAEISGEDVHRVFFIQIETGRFDGPVGQEVLVKVGGQAALGGPRPEIRDAFLRPEGFVVFPVDEIEFAEQFGRIGYGRARGNLP